MKNSSKIDQILKYELDPVFKRRAKIILQELQKANPTNILDVGCGRGFYEKSIGFLLPKANVVGIDTNATYLKSAKRFANNNIKFIKTSADSLPFSNNYFDAIICSEVLEHIGNDKLALKEMNRALKPQGTMLITVPNKNYPFLWDPLNWILERFFRVHIPSNIWWLAGIWADHIRLYTEDGLLGKLQKAGFVNQKIWRSTHYCLPFSHFFLYGIGKNLIEAGFCKSFDRFTNKKKRSFLLTLILTLFNLFDRKNDAITLSQKDPFANIIVKAQK